MLGGLRRMQMFHRQQLKHRNCNPKQTKILDVWILFFNQKTWISSSEPFADREFLVTESLFKSNPNACLAIISNAMDFERENGLLRPAFLDKGFKVTAISELKKINVDPRQKEGRRCIISCASIIVMIADSMVAKGVALRWALKIAQDCYEI
ncbi:hypothetical protein RCOM_0597320 [Ricinus communis]|uniref:Uncharacterized protein n=1 Tax=Ricinus communis TaxID=3988 RepID=B9SIZ8_RICCO|nr:hypothetical protein RCOM_0597320 [Ricinus communis]